MTTRIMPEDDYQRMVADARLARATAMQANVCITRLVAALAEVAPSHPLLTELPFSQYVPERLPESETYPCKGCNKPISAYELCEECAKGNDPFFTSKYKGDFTS